MTVLNLFQISIVTLSPFNIQLKMWVQGPPALLGDSIGISQIGQKVFPRSDQLSSKVKKEGAGPGKSMRGRDYRDCRNPVSRSLACLRGR